jgi:hypothetical protein
VPGTTLLIVYDMVFSLTDISDDLACDKNIPGRQIGYNPIMIEVKSSLPARQIISAPYQLLEIAAEVLNSISQLVYFQRHQWS